MPTVSEANNRFTAHYLRVLADAVERGESLALHRDIVNIERALRRVRKILSAGRSLYERIE